MITSFKGQYEFLSNFSPAIVTFEGKEYPTVEHAYQAAKTLSEAYRFYVGIAPTAGEAKKRGRRVPIREDWNQVKIVIMRELLRQKFTCPNLKSQLLATGDAELVEGNWWGDTFWGVCNGTGDNHLGKLLMELRKSLVGT